MLGIESRYYSYYSSIYNEHKFENIIQYIYLCNFLSFPSYTRRNHYIMASQLPAPPAGFQYYQTPVGLQLGPVNQYMMTSRVNEAIPPIHSAPTPSPPQPTPFTFYLPVNPECIGLIVGSKGRTIKRIQAETSTQIRLNQPDLEKNKTLPSFAITGFPVSVSRACVKITEIACEAKHRIQHGVSSSSHYSVPVPTQADFPVLVASGTSVPIHPAPVQVHETVVDQPQVVSYSSMASGADEVEDVES